MNLSGIQNIFLLNNFKNLKLNLIYSNFNLIFNINKKLINKVKILHQILIVYIIFKITYIM